MTVPYTFAAATSAIPLSQLDSNFATTITLGNTAIQLGNTVTTLNNMTLANVTISSGTVSITNVTVTTANVSTLNVASSIVTSSETLTYGTANGVLYLNGSKVATSGSALQFSGSILTVTGSTTNVGEGSAINGLGNGFTAQRSTNDSQLYIGYRTTPDAWVIGATYATTGAYKPIAFAVNDAEQMRLTSTGLGIGTSSPSAKLTVAGDIYQTGAYVIANTSNDLYLQSTTASTSIIFRPGGTTERMRLDSSGNLGIGTSSPGSKLDVLGTGSGVASIKSSTSAYALKLQGSTTTNAVFLGASGDNFVVYVNGADRMTLDSSGNLGLGVTPSLWTGSGGTSFEVGALGNSIFGSASLTSHTSNTNFDSAWKYSRTGYASRYDQQDSVHKWFNAPSGTAGTAISFTQAMTLDASGNLGVGTSSFARRLTINNTSSSYLGYQVAGAEKWVAGVDTSNRYILFDSVASTNRLMIDTSGNLTAGTSGVTATFGGNTNTAIGGLIGRIVFQAGDPANNYSAGIRSYVPAGSGGIDYADLRFYTSNGSAALDQERMRLDYAGRLGLGVTPDAWQSSYSVFQVGSYSALTGQGSNLLQLVNNAYVNASSIWTYRGSAASSMYRLNGNEHQWFTAASGTAGNAISWTQAATLDASGNWLLGTTSSTSTNSNSFIFSPFSNGAYEVIQHASGTASGQRYTYYYYNNTEIGSVTQNGTTAVAFNTTSDRRLKQNIVPAPSASDDIDAIQIVSHDWKAAPDEHVKFGVIAQDLHAVAPQAVSVGDDGDEIEKTWGVDYSKLVPMLIKEVQELRARVAQLEAKG